jgi:site-specific DNA-methyltransferase (adenine-specific)
MSSAKSDWQTPAEVLDRVRRVAPIALDPATTRDNPTGAAVICVEHGPMPGDAEVVLVDGLAEGRNWQFPGPGLPEEGLIYVNPPYGRDIWRWTGKCRWEGIHGAEVIALLPARTDTRCWEDCTPPDAAQAVCFWRGRLTFVGAPNCAPFPSCLVYYGPRKFRFADAFADAGAIWI